MAAPHLRLVDMAKESPQLENGYTRVANDLLDAMVASGMTARQWAVAMAVVRKTYGFNKKQDDIGLGQLMSMTGIDKAHLSRTVRELADLKVITRSAGTHGHNLGINKDFRQWGLPKEQPVAESATRCQKSNPPVAESATPPVAERATTKDNPSKDNYQKTKPFCAPQADRAAKPTRAGQTGRAMTVAMQERFDRFWSAYPRKRSKGAAEKAFAKLNPDDDLLALMLDGIKRCQRSSDWAQGYVPYPATWINAKGWLDEISDAYDQDELAVIEAYNVALGDLSGHIDPTIYSEQRAGKIRDFMGLSDKPEFWTLFFPWVRENSEYAGKAGFDWLISREGFSTVKGGHRQREQ